MNWYKKADYIGRDPYSVDFAAEEAKAQGMSEDELIGALSDAIEAAGVSANQGKYTDQASVYRKELISRGIPIAEQDLRVKATPSLHTSIPDRRELAVKLLEWHGGQGSPLYAVGSSWLAGKEVSNEYVEWAIQELKSELRRAAAHDSLAPPEDSVALSQLIKQLQQELQRGIDNKQQSEDEDAQSAYEAEMGRDTYVNHGDGFQAPEDTSL